MAKQTPRTQPSPPSLSLSLSPSPLPLHHVPPPSATHVPVNAIWDPDVALHLRQHHRTFGDFAGTLPKHLAQNQSLSLPLLLSPEETRLAVAANAVQPLCDAPDNYPVPSLGVVEAFKEDREANVEAQVEAAVEKQREQRRKYTVELAVEHGDSADGDVDDKKYTAKRGDIFDRVDSDGDDIFTTSDDDRKNVASVAVLDTVCDASPASARKKRKRKRESGLVNNGYGEAVPRTGAVSGVGASSISAEGTNEGQHEPLTDGGVMKRMRSSIFGRAFANLRAAISSFANVVTPERQPPVQIAHTVAENGTRGSDGARRGDVTATECPEAKEEDEQLDEEGGDAARGIDRDEMEEAAKKEAMRQRVIDEKVRRQARATSTILTATAARSDEISDSVRRPIAIAAPFPSTDVNSAADKACARLAHARQTIFNDLHARGFTMTCGAKFGADFLAYAADPMIVHSVLAVVVVEGAEHFSPRDVVALGRLGDATHKRAVLAWVEEDDTGDGTVEYLGVQWEETLP